MLSCYSVNLAGPSHLDRGIPCQDSYAKRLCGNYFVLAVADGIGSLSQSNIGSYVAANALVDYCAENLCDRDSSQDLLELMRDGFHAANDAIAEAAAKDERLVESQMGTTLCAVLWDTSTKVAFIG